MNRIKFIKIIIKLNFFWLVFSLKFYIKYSGYLERILLSELSQDLDMGNVDG